MKKIIILTVSILGCLFVLDRVISVCLDNLYSQNYWGESGGHLNYYLNRPENPDLLIIGDSRAHRHIIPDSFDCKAFSLCHHGMNLIFHVGILHILEQQNKLPKTILLHLEHNEFAQPEGAISDNNDIQHLRYFYGINPYITDKINQLSATEKILYFWKSYRYNGKLTSLLKNVLISRKNYPKHNGFEAIQPEKLDSVRVLSEVKQHEIEDSKEKQWKTDTKSIELLDDFITVCKRNNINLVCFISPFYFKAGAKQQFASTNISDFLKERQVAFIDFSIARPNEFDNLHLWRDSYHLNINGAKILTSHLKSGIKTLCSSNPTIK